MNKSKKIISLLICLYMLVCLLTVAAFAAGSNASVTAVPTGKSGLTYSGNAQQLISTGGTAQNGTMMYSLVGSTGPWTSDATAITGTEIRAYTVYYKAAGDGVNYTDSAVSSITVNIAKEKLTISSATVDPKVYDGGVDATGAVVEFKNSKGATVTLLEGTDYSVQAVFTDANVGNNKNVTVHVTLMGTAKDHYNLSDGGTPHKGIKQIKNQVITKQPVAIPTLAPKTYNGSTLTASIMDSRYTALKNDGGVHVGEYDVVLTLSNPANYKWATTDATSVTCKFNIVKAVNGWSTSPSISNWTYGQKASEPTGAAKFGKVTYTYYDSAKKAIEKPSVAGTYYMKAAVAANGNDYDSISTDYIYFTIMKLTVDIPAKDNTVFVFNKKEQTYNIPANSGYTVTGSKRTNAGTQTVTVTLKDSTNSEWSDGSTAAKTYSFVINKLEVSVPVANTGSFTYNGKAQTYALTKSDYYTVKNNVQTNSGTYEVKVVLTDKVNCCWRGEGDTADKNYSFKINSLKMPIPAKDNTVYYYNGKNQVYGIPTSDFYTLSGNINKNAGSYTVKVKLKDTVNSSWTDGSTNEKTYSFVINKQNVAIPSVEPKPYNGKEQIANIVANEAYTVKENKGGINAGSYNVVLAITDSSNYRWAGKDGTEITVKFNITKAVNEWTVEPDIAGWTYGGTVSIPKGEAKFGQVMFALYDSDKKSLAAMPTNAGTYYMIASVAAGGENYNALATDYIEFIIEKATPQTSFPTDVKIDADNKLSDIKLSELVGYTWDAPNTVVICGINEYSMTFTPEDTENYVSVTKKIKVEGIHDYTDLLQSESEHWYECTICREEMPKSRELHKLLGCKSNEDDTHTGTCEVCSRVVTVACAGGEATCTDVAVCAACAHTYGKIDPDNHDFETPWLKDEEFHWHYCARCDANSPKLVHIYNDGLRCRCGESNASTVTAILIVVGTVLVLGGGTLAVMWFVLRKKYSNLM